MKKCQHRCKWEKTGRNRYSFSDQYEEECKICGKKRWKKYDEKSPAVKSGSKEWEEFRRRHINGD